MTSMPKAPIAAASVGVKRPMKIPPITRVNTASVSPRPSSALNFSVHVNFSPQGPCSGLMRHLM